MSNIQVGANRYTFEDWVNRAERKRGFLSYYNNEPFDYEGASAGYELGRQLAVMAKLDGLRRGDVLRKKPKSDKYAFTKTKIVRLEQLAIAAGFRTKLANGTLFGDI